MPYGHNVIDLANNHFGQANGSSNHQLDASGQNGQPETADAVMRSVETGQAHSTSPLQFGKSYFLNVFHSYEHVSYFHLRVNLGSYTHRVISP
jgi:hypothetical protein